MRPMTSSVKYISNRVRGSEHTDTLGPGSGPVYPFSVNGVAMPDHCKVSVSESRSPSSSVPTIIRFDACVIFFYCYVPAGSTGLPLGEAGLPTGLPLGETGSTGLPRELEGAEKGLEEAAGTGEKSMSSFSTGKLLSSYLICIMYALCTYQCMWP